MGMIFFFSSQTADESGGLSGKILSAILSVFFLDTAELPFQDSGFFSEGFHSFFRKLVHFLEYGVLGILWTLTTRCGHWFEKPCKAWRIVLPFCISLLYAVSDEIHQLFVDGRSGEIRDVCIDFCGACTGILILTLIAKRIQKNRKSA